jgi:hypothetical protein
MFRLPRFGRERPPIERGRPHAFQAINDPGLAAFASGAGNRGGVQPAVGSVVLADNYVRKSNCGVPGCGKPRQDPIHEFADE